MRTKYQLAIDIAIIPNHADAYLHESQSDGLKDMICRHVEGYNKRFGTQIDPTEQCVQIWYGSEEDSYQNGGLPECWNKLFPYEEKETKRERGFVFDKYGNRSDILPHMLPAKLFVGKKEGDRVIIFDSNDVVVYGILNQKNNRYSGFGTFEEVFNKVTK